MANEVTIYQSVIGMWADALWNRSRMAIIEPNMVQL